MLQAQRYVAAQLWSPVVGHVLSASEADTLIACLHDDATTLTNAAAISILDAIRGLQLEFFSWATVKLYYSVYYSLRAILAQSRFCLIYDGSKPRTLRAMAGSVCAKAAGTSHKVVITQFTRELAGHWLLSQEIALQSPPEWLMHLREEANYGGEFWEPDCPKYFEALVSNGIRRSVAAYVNDRTFAFDEDHAALAYPLHALIEARSKLKPMEEAEAEFVRTRARDAKGPLAELIGKLTGI